MATLMTATEFAKTHAVASDWVAAWTETFGDKPVQSFSDGERVTYNGRQCVVARHYYCGMYDVRVSGGLACVSGTELSPI